MKRHQLQTWNRGKHRQRRLGDTLRVLEMAGRVVGDFDWEHPARFRPGGGEQLAHIADPRRESRCSLVPLGIILQQVSVLFHDRTAAGRIYCDE